ncbi:hypothetical protein [Chryseobacterium luteum]|uniref:Pectate lyase superfamily protein domain-containing protein n=1 Tax=Chryseobacterium luteum TaxID=421531 RepID=A0A085YY46_9FLAO|nr:hypothetical protein [Chryseobacterium luteum]KFE97109.1 hypothetical protein IX38_21550 [Chryseobacterium luteum]
MATKQIEDQKTGELISLLPLAGIPPYVDNVIYFNGAPSDPSPYYKRYIESDVNVRWFGAKGDGITDDSTAFREALYFCYTSDYKTLLIPEGYVFNLNDEIIEVLRITLRFTGGVIKNAKLHGANAMIQAPPYRIFDTTVSLVYDWISADGFAYPEWFGTLPYDRGSVDLKDSLEKLQPFWNIKFGVGVYYSKKGEIPVRHFEGISRDHSRIEINLDNETNDVKYGFCLGEYEGLVRPGRTYFNTLREISVVTTSLERKRNYSGVVMGNAHNGKIENVIVNNSGDNMKMDENDLEYIVADIEKRYKNANIGLEFRGCSELTVINNLETYSDVGIGFNTTMNDQPATQEQGVDWPSIYNFTSDCGAFGLANVFFGAPNVYNLVMNGIQSWNRGMYGLYACRHITPTSFMHCSISNVRIEQLTELKDKDGKMRSTSIYIDYQRNIENFIFTNIRVSGHSNGIYIDGAVRGYVEFSNVSGGSDVKLQYLIQTNHETYSSFAVRFKNITSDVAYPLIHNGGMVIDHHYYEKSPIAEYKVNYHDVTVIRKASVIFKNEFDGARKFIQKEAGAHDSWIKLYHSHFQDTLDPWLPDEKYVSYDIDMCSDSYALKASLTLFRNGTYYAGPYDTSKIFIGNTLNAQAGKINIVYETSTGYWFFINVLGDGEVHYEIEGLIK